MQTKSQRNIVYAIKAEIECNDILHYFITRSLK